MFLIITKFLLLILSLLLAYAFIDELEFKRYDQPWFINSSALTIASVTYNPTYSKSSWINRLFGQEAIFHNRTYRNRVANPLTPDEKRERTKVFSDFFRLPPEAVLPPCSIEILAYALVDHDHPITHEDMYLSPSTGKATLHFFNTIKLPKTIDSSWTCYYRAMYEFSPSPLILLNINHWPVFLYCPAPNYDQSCLNLVTLHRKTLVYHIDHLKQQQQQQQQSSFKINDDNTGNKNDQLDSLNQLMKRASKLSLLHVQVDFLLQHTIWTTHFTIDLINSIHKSQLKDFDYYYDQHRSSYTTTTSNTTSSTPYDTTSSTPYDTTSSSSPSQSRERRRPKKAICTVIPYSVSESQRQSINNILLYEFIRYHSHLDFQLLIFERQGGAHYSSLSHHPYVLLQEAVTRDKPGSIPRSRSRSTTRFDEMMKHVDYYNYTVLQKLLPGLDYYKASQVDRNKLSKTIVLGDIDKRLTYTYCRFVAKQRYHIEDVFILDYDEFLYCPRVVPTRSTRDTPDSEIRDSPDSVTRLQRSYIDSYFAYMKAKGIEQLIMKQRVVASKTNNMTDCLLQEIHRSSTLLQQLQLQPSSNTSTSTSPLSLPSLFHCIGAFQFLIKTYFDKCMHFGHLCPFTAFHYASYLRYYDCHLNSYMTGSRYRRNHSLSGCSLIHITTKPSAYNRSHSYDHHLVQSLESELIAISRGL
jgi:hypothetical protein